MIEVKTKNVIQNKLQKMIFHNLTNSENDHNITTTLIHTTRYISRLDTKG